MAVTVALNGTLYGSEGKAHCHPSGRTVETQRQYDVFFRTPKRRLKRKNVRTSEKDLI